MKWNHRDVRLTVSAALVLLVALPHAARADADSDAEVLEKQGIDLRRQGQDLAALPLFKRAFKLAPNGRSAGQLGLCEMALGAWVDSEEDLGNALSHSDESWVNANHAALERAFNEVHRHVGGLEVVGTPAGASVYVGGHLAGVLPLPKPIRIARGRIVLKVDAAGFDPVEREVAIGPAPAREMVNLGRSTGGGPTNGNQAGHGAASNDWTRAFERARLDEGRPTDVEYDAIQARRAAHPWWFDAGVATALAGDHATTSGAGLLVVRGGQSISLSTRWQLLIGAGALAGYIENQSVSPDVARTSWGALAAATFMTTPLGSASPWFANLGVNAGYLHMASTFVASKVAGIDSYDGRGSDDDLLIQGVLGAGSYFGQSRKWGASVQLAAGYPIVWFGAGLIFIP